MTDLRNALLLALGPVAMVKANDDPATEIEQNECERQWRETMGPSPDQEVLDARTPEEIRKEEK